jgi:hypothetical protein
MRGSGYFQIPARTGQDEIWLETTGYVADTGNLFPLHEACIFTSRRAIEHHQSHQTRGKRKAALAILNDLLNTHLSRKNPEAVHEHRTSEDLSIDYVFPQWTIYDIFDLSSRSTVHGPRSVLAMNRLEWRGGMYEVGQRPHSSRTPLKLSRDFMPTRSMSPTLQL